MRDVGSDKDEDEMTDKHMTTVSQHYFVDESDKPSFSIAIIENMKEEYGLFVWPCSVILAEYVWQQRYRFSGANVVELGAGTSLPGLVAAKVGSNVTLTDDSNRIEVLKNMRRVCEMNKLNCRLLMTSLPPSHICSRVLQDQSSLRLIIIEVGIILLSS
ncbi:hypothetical protein CISIN_1g026274mg [Citrus sinensis]|uniref:Methyltransferase-like protein 23 n=1 Tax=Citrus sinensis TaxID=2711 RepID=A0A067FVA5_CITSI|nr:hypothetical protein CISIN_1g026274mg [Citrus sinensis]